MFAEYDWYLVLNFVYREFNLDFKPSQFAFLYNNMLRFGFETRVCLDACQFLCRQFRCLISLYPFHCRVDIPQLHHSVSKRMEKSALSQTL